MEREGFDQNLVAQSRARIAHSRATIKNTLRLVGREASEVEGLSSGPISDQSLYSIEDREAQTEQTKIDAEVHQTIVEGWPSRSVLERFFGVNADRV